MEGTWLTHYQAGARHGDGIVILREGELLGGDPEHVWSGIYEEETPKLYARIRIVPFVTRPEESTMARERPVIMTLSGFFTEEYATLDGHPDEREDLPFHVEMRRYRGVRQQEMQKAA